MFQRVEPAGLKAIVPAANSSRLDAVNSFFVGTLRGLRPQFVLLHTPTICYSVNRLRFIVWSLPPGVLTRKTDPN